MLSSHAIRERHLDQIAGVLPAAHEAEKIIGSMDMPEHLDAMRRTAWVLDFGTIRIVTLHGVQPTVRLHLEREQGQVSGCLRVDWGMGHSTRALSRERAEICWDLFGPNISQ